VTPDLHDAFEAEFGNAPGSVWFSPGRANLIGEHVDYNGGLVLPVAINLGTSFLVRRNTLNRIRIRSLAYADVVDVSLQDICQASARHHWSDYVIGVAQVLLDGSTDAVGVDLLIDSNLPEGVGLSSSASITVGTAFVLNDEWRLGHDNNKLIQIAQNAENDFVGVDCGVLDPFAVTTGRAGCAMGLCCEDMQWEYVPFPADEFSIVVADTGETRNLRDTPYNQRREESASALAFLVSKVGCASANDLTIEHLDYLRCSQLPEVSLKRARHVISENERVRAAIRALHENDMLAFGQAQMESHASLRDDYEVSCSELDVMVELAMQSKSCIGAKMSGAGFGGAAIAVVASHDVDRFIADLDSRYREATRHAPSFHVCRPGDGVRKTGLRSADTDATESA
jgi:galactokinase